MSPDMDNLTARSGPLSTASFGGPLNPWEHLVGANPVRRIVDRVPIAASEAACRALP